MFRGQWVGLAKGSGGVSLLYDHNSQCYSCMSIVKNIDLIYQ